MARFTSLFIMAFLLLTLSMATGLRPEPAVGETKMRMCEAPSQHFRGPCVRASNCASVCQTEHFFGGNCRGLRRRCFCTKPC